MDEPSIRLCTEYALKWKCHDDELYYQAQSFHVYERWVGVLHSPLILGIPWPNLTFGFLFSSSPAQANKKSCII